jgi:hypothetical protein
VDPPLFELPDEGRKCQISSMNSSIVHRASFIRSLREDEASSRLNGFNEWLKGQPELHAIIDRLKNREGVPDLLGASEARRFPPQPATPEEIAGVGLLLLDEIRPPTDAWSVANKYHIEPSGGSGNLQECFDEMWARYIGPAIEFVEGELQRTCAASVALVRNIQEPSAWYPLEITESLNRFRIDHPEPRRTAFIMMRFGTTPAHTKIVEAIQSTVTRYGIKAIRADEKEYHDDLFANVLTYLYGCGFGIAVFERLEADDFNPNVSLEVGYMRALRKQICLLKDKTLATLQTDLVGKLYKTFDPQSIKATLPAELEKWLRDKDIITA